MTNTSQNIYILLIGLTPVKSFVFIFPVFVCLLYEMSSFKLVPSTIILQLRHSQTGERRVLKLPSMRIACRLSLPSAAGGKRPARERDFQVCTKPTTRTGSSFKLVSLLDFDFCPLSFAETGTVENTSHALVNKQRNPCTNQSPANRITKYPC